MNQKYRKYMFFGYLVLAKNNFIENIENKKDDHF
ncbi:hypothetical protein CLV94_1596 [Flavobacterium endophyticum]|jgi:hypothetical protein|uniref:Uncharacterized protein n=1 Tax=Flavobacterium endophyticum TaxID=1540163 RepID=A0A495MMB8_9FLAO|nr:hypothetical protein CLV94_1596 [Flavobacterium endophyticum]